VLTRVFASFQGIPLTLAEGFVNRRLVKQSFPLRAQLHTLSTSSPNPSKGVMSFRLRPSSEALLRARAPGAKKAAHALALIATRSFLLCQVLKHSLTAQDGILFGASNNRRNIYAFAD
jgi:hypothetical protein